MNFFNDLLKGKKHLVIFFWILCITQTQAHNAANSTIFDKISCKKKPENSLF